MPPKPGTAIEYSYPPEAASYASDERAALGPQTPARTPTAFGFTREELTPPNTPDRQLQQSDPMRKMAFDRMLQAHMEALKQRKVAELAAQRAQLQMALAQQFQSRLGQPGGQAPSAQLGPGPVQMSPNPMGMPFGGVPLPQGAR